MAQGVKGIPISKECFRCKIVTPSCDFYITKGSINRLSTYCKKCTAEWRQTQRSKNKKELKSTNWKKVVKKCLTCEKVLPAVKFNFDFSRLDGLQSHCRSCIRVKFGRKSFEEYLEENHIQTDLAKDGKKKCKKCHVVRKASEFFKNKKRKDGLRSRCKLCEKEAQRIRYERVGHEEARERRKGIKSKPESYSYWRERVKPKVHKGIDPYALKDKYFKDPSCQYCGIKFGHPEEAQLDHDNPRSRGGLNEIKNIVFACSPCNRMKGNMIGSEFVEFLKMYFSRLHKKFGTKVVLRCVTSKEKCG